VTADRVPRVAGLVLAAGAGRRFGRPKALVVIDGGRLVDRAVGVLRSGGVGQVYVVSGALPVQVPGATVVDNQGWESGMGSSLRAGLAALPGDADAVVVMLVDQPGLTSAAVRRVVESASGPASVAVATYGGHQGHPVLIGRDHWERVREMAGGDVGAREFLAAYPSVQRVECADVADPTDLDTPGDLDRWLAARDVRG
jgi:nicotine blue oxidoreductase